MNYFHLLLVFPAIVSVRVGFIHFTQPVPDFLSNLSLKAQYDYKMILENETIPINTRSADFKKWATTYDVTTQYTQYEAQQSSTKVQMEKNVTQLISQLSVANSQITKILENGSLSIEEQREAVKELGEQQYSKEVSTILFIRRLFNPQDTISSKRSVV